MQEYKRKINRGFQLTIPQAFRDAHHLHIGDYLRIYEDNGKLVVEPVNILPKNPVDALEALFKSAPQSFSDLSEDEVMKIVREEIKKVRKTTSHPKRKGSDKDTMK